VEDLFMMARGLPWEEINGYGKDKSARSICNRWNKERKSWLSKKKGDKRADHLPKGQLIGLSQKLVDMIRIWKVFGRVICVGGEQ
jgi:hypothetical protein